MHEGSTLWHACRRMCILITPHYHAKPALELCSFAGICKQQHGTVRMHGCTVLSHAASGRCQQSCTCGKRAPACHACASMLDHESLLSIAAWLSMSGLSSTSAALCNRVAVDGMHACSWGKQVWVLYCQGILTQLRNPSDVAGRIFVTLLINLLVSPWPLPGRENLACTVSCSAVLHEHALQSCACARACACIGSANYAACAGGADLLRHPRQAQCSLPALLCPLLHPAGVRVPSELPMRMLSWHDSASACKHAARMTELKRVCLPSESPMRMPYCHDNELPAACCTPACACARPTALLSGAAGLSCCPSAT